MVNGVPGWSGYYLSAYGLAVKRGFPGTEQEWLDSLHGADVEMRCENGELQWKHDNSEEWHTLEEFTVLRELLEEKGESARAAAELAEEKAQAAETATGLANAAAQAAESSAGAANSAAGGAVEAQEAAQTAAAGAETQAAYAKAQGDRVVQLMEALTDEISGKRSVTKIVGTSTAGWTEADCDYLCDGVDDEKEINEALGSLPAEGGEVRLLPGTYIISNNLFLEKGLVLRGNGESSQIQASDNGLRGSAMIYMIGGDLCDLSLKGNAACYGIEISPEDSATVRNCTIQMADVNNGIWFTSYSDGAEARIFGNRITGGYGINCAASASKLWFCNNLITSDTSFPIYTQGLSQGVIANNVIAPISSYNKSQLCGMALNDCTNCLIQGNFLIPTKGDGETTGSGITMSGGTRNSIIGNTFFVDSWSSSAYSIRLVGSGNDHNLIADNYIFGKNYVSGGGTGNTFVNNKYE